MTTLTPITHDDLEALMRIERSEGYEGLVGRWERDVHEVEMASPDARYLAWREGGELVGFVILQEFNSPVVLLRRIAVAKPGAGTGTALLRAVMDWVFTGTKAQAMRLHVHHGNERAGRVYLREGFEGMTADESGINMQVERARWASMR
ncbi:MAG: GNAT family N-acetyltransferase [Phenylobacterium sp.]